jgi:hypothetical protein
MKSTEFKTSLLERLAEVRERCPEMRFGQVLATIGLLAEDETGHSLWDVEDTEFAAAVERFAADLAGRDTRCPSERGPLNRAADYRSGSSPSGASINLLLG